MPIQASQHPRQHSCSTFEFSPIIFLWVLERQNICIGWYLESNPVPLGKDSTLDQYTSYLVDAVD